MRFGAKGLMSTLMRVRISSDAPRCTVQFGALDPRCTMVQVHGDPNEPSLGAGAAGAPCVTLLVSQKENGFVFSVVLLIPHTHAGPGAGRWEGGGVQTSGRYNLLRFLHPSTHNLGRSLWGSTLSNSS